MPEVHVEHSHCSFSNVQDNSSLRHWKWRSASAVLDVPKSCEVPELVRTINYCCAKTAVLDEVSDCFQKVETSGVECGVHEVLQAYENTGFDGAAHCIQIVSTVEKVAKVP